MAFEKAFFDSIYQLFCDIMQFYLHRFLGEDDNTEVLVLLVDLVAQHNLTLLIQEPCMEQKGDGDWLAPHHSLQILNGK